MWSNIQILGFGLALATLSSAIPATSVPVGEVGPYDSELYSSFTKRIISPAGDDTCGLLYNGGNKGYSCDASINLGGCCSQYGYCGNATEYCGDGCQTEYGVCITSGPSAPEPSTYECGPAFSGAICASGLCCSGSGYCGNTTDYCDTTLGCQSSYGICNTDASAGAGGTCGPAFGNARCPNMQCCSLSGYCGTTTEYCSDPGSCMQGFGKCDSDTLPDGPFTWNKTSEPRSFKGPVSYTSDIFACSQPNVVALTYDDGPYIYTAKLLDILKEYNFQATFFMTGNNNGKGQIDKGDIYPDLIKRMVAEGHQIASHTWSHYSLSNITSELRISQMVKNEMAINNIIGMWPTYMRPPYSQCSEASGCWADMEKLGYHRVYFDLDTQDYLNPLPSQVQNSKDVVKQYMSKTPNDYLAIQHDIGEQSVTNLTSYFFDLIRDKGWRGVTAGECLGDTDRRNWYRTFGEAASSTSTSLSSSTSLPVSQTTGTSSSVSISSSASQTSSAESSTSSSSMESSSNSKLSSTTSSIKTSTSSSKLSSTTSSSKTLSSSSKLSSTTSSSKTLSSSSKLSSTTSSSKTLSSSSKLSSTVSTSKGSSSSSRRSRTRRSTTRSTTKTSSTSATIKSSSSKATPTSSCGGANGNKCDIIGKFTGQNGCRQELQRCNDAATTCNNSLSNLVTCTERRVICAELSFYCTVTCLLRLSCTDVDFKL